MGRRVRKLMDFLTKQQRSRQMSRIRSVSGLERRSKPAAEHAAGCRLRSGKSGLPGKPDYFNKSKRTVVFIHGCFWHSCPAHGKMPEANREFWSAKLAANAERDRMVLGEYAGMGWKAIVLWEHSLKQAKAGSNLAPKKEGNYILNTRKGKENQMKVLAIVTMPFRGLIGLGLLPVVVLALFVAAIVSPESTDWRIPYNKAKNFMLYGCN